MDTGKSIPRYAIQRTMTAQAHDEGPKPGQGRLDALRLRTERVPREQQRPVPAGDDPLRRTQSCTTSHMLVADWSAAKGWEAPRIVPCRPFSLSPTASVLHYGTSCFVRVQDCTTTGSCLFFLGIFTIG